MRESLASRFADAAVAEPLLLVLEDLALGRRREPAGAEDAEVDTVALQGRLLLLTTTSWRSRPRATDQVRWRPSQSLSGPSAQVWRCELTRLGPPPSPCGRGRFVASVVRDGEPIRARLTPAPTAVPGRLVVECPPPPRT